MPIQEQAAENSFDRGKLVCNTAVVALKDTDVSWCQETDHCLKNTETLLTGI